jgi:hypothetical protein
MKWTPAAPFGAEERVQTLSVPDHLQPFWCVHIETRRNQPEFLFDICGAAASEAHFVPAK